ncbi:MAG TPA: methyltransferase domain-containing protein [Gaiellaceae bacterium]|jgi:ubiquinone/menaquinone biosynthesis C-methylase UbiE|nr:methyltransferase domain-containing protein [Gaiellaceae bacterium]
MSTKAERFAALQAERAAALSRRLDDLLDLHGDERALDVGAGTGALAFALAPRVASMVALDADGAMIEHARAAAPANVEAVVGDGERLPFDGASFDLAGTLRTLHHTPHPGRLLAELRRVVRPGGTLLVADQLAPEDGEGADALNRFERARDASTTRVLAETELRALFADAGLRVRRAEIVREPRDLESYLDLAGCTGAQREEARRLAPAGYTATLGWFVLG